MNADYFGTVECVRHDESQTTAHQPVIIKSDKLMHIPGSWLYKRVRPQARKITHRVPNLLREVDFGMRVKQESHIGRICAKK